ncbi:MAG: mannose-1-phosphate guanylyltransferase/mannose-6-phosphate isomerase [Halieaceae bacterium]|nr:mannose-1-phosphate guanylyltransferase/mannose-6-phosphate isomerase [Halieaceae bacterium]
MLKPVLLAGGVGSRLWPVSRQVHPKQFQSMTGESSLLVDTVRRIETLQAGAPLVVCNEDYRFIAAEQLRSCGVDDAEILLEPSGRNTAPALAAAALHALKGDGQALLLILPADHLIKDTAAFVSVVREALPLAQMGRLVTFGIRPDKAETGYGYIRCGENLSTRAYAIDNFVEKPDLETAQDYVSSDDYLWNSGMFLFSAQTCVEELRRLAPALLQACEKALAGGVEDLDFTRLDAGAFSACPAESIDRAVMEKTTRGAVLELDCGWSDVGSWSTLWEVGERDGDGNVTQGDVLLSRCRDSFVRSESRLVAATEVRDLVVVETADAVLVTDRNRVQSVKHLVQTLKQQQRAEAEVHAKVYRPWGSYESLIVGDRFQVKRIVVNPYQKLSLQKHQHRAEHWVVVHGTAEVTCDGRVYRLAEDESTYIPLGYKHRLANPCPELLELIEVQSGSYLGEDDIVRYEDEYGRSDD